jgi:hypothetical protein
VTGTPPPTDDDVRAHVIDVATALHQQLAAITIDMRTELAARITELGEDERLIDLLGASIEGNVDNILHSLRYGIPVDRIEPPSAGFEYARRLAQRGVPVNALVRAYRLGQQYLLRAAYEESRSRTIDVAVQHLAYDRIVTNTFDYIDMMSQQVVVVYEASAWIWLTVPDNFVLDTAAIETTLITDDPPQAMLALGRKLPGLAGFRESHQDALDAQRVCVVGDLRRPVVSYDETGVGIASLLARSPTATRRWVSATLGELATQDEHHQRLRDTLRLFLHHEGSYTAGCRQSRR